MGRVRTCIDVFRTWLAKNSGAVTYAAMAVTAIILVALIQKRSDDADKHLAKQVRIIDKRFQKQSKQIVKTGRRAIESGCNFDNQRAKQIRVILRRSQQGAKRAYREGQISKELLDRNTETLNRAIKSITIRNCEKAAEILTAK